MIDVARGVQRNRRPGLFSAVCSAGRPSPVRALPLPGDARRAGERAHSELSSQTYAIAAPGM